MKVMGTPYSPNTTSGALPSDGLVSYPRYSKSFYIIQLTLSKRLKNSLKHKGLGVCLTQEKFEEHGQENHIGTWAWHEHLIDRTEPLRPSTKPNKGLSGALQITWWLRLPSQAKYLLCISMSVCLLSSDLEFFMCALLMVLNRGDNYLVRSLAILWGTDPIPGRHPSLT